MDVVGDGKFGVGGGFFAGAAIEALVVAAVGDGDAEVGDGAAEAVAQARLCGFGGAQRQVRGREKLGGGGLVERRWKQGSDGVTPTRVG
ncbi:MAG TPA: hypothetical protein VGU46_09105 [Acidobacteriaceae bacterium]|nr:hypothetical protein [Acidobacteriaceae bacterium]